MALAAAGAEGIELPNLHDELEQFERDLAAPPEVDTVDPDRMVLLKALGLR